MIAGNEAWKIVWAGTNGNVVVYAYEFTINHDSALEQATGSDSDGHYESVAGIDVWDGTFTALLDRMTVLPLAGSALTAMQIYYKNILRFSGNAKIVRWSISVNQDDDPIVNIIFQGNGALTSS